MIRLRHFKMLPILEAIKFVLFVVMVLMFINFNAKIATQAAQTKKVADSTNSIVKSQADILNAIKAVTDDTHTTAAQQTAIIICMLQVPVENRTTDLQSQCRDHATTVVSDSGAQTTQNSNGTVGSGSSSNTSSNNTTAQGDKSQTPTTPEKQTLEVLGVPLCIPFTNMCARQ